MGAAREAGQDPESGFRGWPEESGFRQTEPSRRQTSWITWQPADSHGSCYRSGKGPWEGARAGRTKRGEKWPRWEHSRAHSA